MNRSDGRSQDPIDRSDGSRRAGRGRDTGRPVEPPGLSSELGRVSGERSLWYVGPPFVAVWLIAVSVLLGLTVMAFVATFDSAACRPRRFDGARDRRLRRQRGSRGWRVRLVARLIHWTDELRPKR